MWHALEDDEVVGRAEVLRRPDGRTFVAVDAWHADVGAELVETVIRAVPADLYSTVGEDDAVQLALLGLAGFTEVRREDEYVVPVVARGRHRSRPHPGIGPERRSGPARPAG
jgi:hypothetical protein